MFSHLHTAKVKGYKAPHKAVLLLAVIDLVEEGAIAMPRIELTDQLEQKFHAIWHRYLGSSTIFTPDIAKPFFYMQHESFWKLVECEETNIMIASEDSPWVAIRKQTKDMLQGSYSIKTKRKAFAYAEIDNLLLKLLRNADARAMLRFILINEYLSNQPTKTKSNILQNDDDVTFYSSRCMICFLYLQHCPHPPRTDGGGGRILYVMISCNTNP